MNTVQPNSLLQGDCLDIMRDIPDGSVDAIICDLPYGTTTCEWDTIIPFEELWPAYKRVCKEHAAIILTAREPFTSQLIMSNIKNYKHKWVWNKKQSGSFFNAKIMPLQIEEDVLVFCFSGHVNYYPIMRRGEYRLKGRTTKQIETAAGLKAQDGSYNDEYYPVNILEYPNCSNKQDNFHPTQKPVNLFRYLVRTYTNEGETVLDNCCGSGTTAIAAIREKRNYICIEKDPHFYEVARKRIDNELRQPTLF